jgi:hypothetical protein
MNKSDVDLKNGESIFKTGKNLSGEVLQDMEKYRNERNAALMRALSWRIRRR